MGQQFTFTDCDTRGPSFDSQHPQGGAQLSVIPTLEFPRPFSARLFLRRFTDVVHSYTFRQTLTDIK